MSTAIRLGALIEGGKPFLVPESIATQTIGILGQKGAGKSNTEVVLAEEFFAAGIPWVTVDPKGDWFGVRSSRDGQSPGLPIPVLGGLHGDVPLASTEGAQWADVIVDSNLTAVVDVSDFSKNERARFLVDFFDRLYRRHRQEPQVRHVFLEEAHEYIPQMVGREEGRLKEAAARIVLQGRSFGLGCSACSQRSARLHKDVLTQIGTLIAHRTTGPQDRKAIEAWVVEHDLGKELVASLPELHAGEAWVWSPEFLGTLDRVQFRPRQTFDSGATPTVGAKARQITTLADVDLAAIKEQMAESVERAKADDPKLLRKRITELERHLREAQKATPEPTVEQVEVSVPFVPVEVLDAIGHIALKTQHLAESVRSLADIANSQLTTIVSPGRGDTQWRESKPVVSARADPPRVAGSASARGAPPLVPDGDLPGPQRKLLTVLATYGPRTKRQLALLAGYSIGGGAFNNPLGRLRSSGFVDPPKGEPIAITDAGLAALGAYVPLPSGPDLLDHWLAGLPGPARKLLAALAERWPASYTKEELAAVTGYEPSGGAFANPLGKLRTLELVTRGAEVRLTDDFGEAIS